MSIFLLRKKYLFSNRDFFWINRPDIFMCETQMLRKKNRVKPFSFRSQSPGKTFLFPSGRVVPLYRSGACMLLPSGFCCFSVPASHRMPPFPPLEVWSYGSVAGTGLYQDRSFVEPVREKNTFLRIQKNIPPVFSGRTGVFEEKSGKNELEIP